jgi:hypothetical protein
MLIYHDVTLHQIRERSPVVIEIEFLGHKAPILKLMDGKMPRRYRQSWVSGEIQRRWISRSRRAALIVLQGLAAVSIAAQFPQYPAPASHASENSCSMPGLGPGRGLQVRAEDLLSSYNKQAALVHSLHVSAILRAKGGPRYGAKLQEARPAPVDIRFVAPATLRMTGMTPFSGRRTFDMSSDGRDFRLLAPDGNVMRFFVGPVDAPATSLDPRGNLRPEAVLEALHWLPAKLERQAGPGNAAADRSAKIEVELISPAPTGSVRADIEFDLRSGTVTRLDTLDAVGKVATEIDFNDWKRAEEYQGKAEPICFPRRMLVVQHEQDLQVEVKILSMEVNLPLSPLQLPLIPPRGIPVTRVPGPSR